MAVYLGYLFWGLLLVLVDFEVNHFDLFPDFVGYLLVVVGCRGLVSASPQFGTAATFSGLLVGLSLLNLAIRGTALTVLSLAGIALNCSMIWFLLGGIMSLADSYRRPDLAVLAENRRMAYVALMGVVGLILLLAQVSSALGFLLTVVTFVVMLVLVVLILHLIWQMKETVRNGNP
jgi:hypothetical protein